jgi:hypothetical protein
MRADRILTLLIVASVVLALVATLHPSWRGGRGSRSDPGSQIKLVIPPSDEVRVRLRRIENKTLIIQRLDVGELTLFEAAAAFHHLNTTPAEFQDQTWRRWPGADDGERLCRQVIYWADVRWRDSYTPAAAQDRLARLEQELQAHLTAHGGVQLPSRIPEE